MKSPRLCWWVAIGSLAAAEVFAGLAPRPRGEAVEVGQNTVGDQQSVVVGMTPNEDFVVAWQGDVPEALGGTPAQGTFLRSFDGATGAPITNEIELESPANYPAIAVAHDRSAFVVWEGNDSDGVGLRGKRCFEGECSLPFAINTTEAGDQRRAAVAVSPTGDALVVWEGEAQDPGGSDAIVGRYFPNGPSLGGPSAEFIVNATAAGLQRRPIVAYAGPGPAYTVVWDGPTGQGNGILARRVIENAPQGLDVVVADNGASDPAVGVQPTGGIHVFVWVGSDSSGSAVLGRYFTGDLSMAGTQFLVNVIEDGDQTDPDVTVDGFGVATFVWRSTEVPPGAATPLVGSPIFLKGIKGTGGLGGLTENGAEPEALGGIQFTPEFFIAGAPLLGRGRIAGQERGNFVVSWHQSSGADLGAFVRRYGAGIFGDGFEGGNTCTWSSGVGGGCP